MADPKDCPVCTVGRVVRVFSAPECADCGYTWPNYTAFRDTYLGRTKPARKPAPVENDYISSGDMQRDVEAVIETAVLEAEFLTVKRIASRVAEIATTSEDAGEKPQVTLERVLIQITQDIKDAVAKRDGTWDE